MSGSCVAISIAVICLVPQILQKPTQWHCIVGDVCVKPKPAFDVFRFPRLGVIFVLPSVTIDSENLDVFKGEECHCSIHFCTISAMTLVGNVPEI